MASIKIDKYGIYPLDRWGNAADWITPSDLVCGLTALARDYREQGVLAEAKRIDRAVEKMTSTAWYNDFLQYQQQLMRETNETRNIN